MKTVAMVLGLLMLLGGFRVGAVTVEELYAEQLEASGGRELIAALPEETRELLAELGIERLEPQELTELSTGRLGKTVLSVVSAALKGPLATAGTVLLIILLYAWLDGLRSLKLRNTMAPVFGTVCALAVCGCLLLPLTDVIRAVSEAMTSTSVFMGSFTPIYAAALLSSGRAATALSFQSVVLYVSQLLAWLASGVIVPLMTVSLALGVTGAVTPEMRVGSVGKLIAKTATWVLTMGMLLFSGLLSMQALTGQAVDGLGARALRFSVSTFVPVVGGSLGESLSTIRGCLDLLHSTLGSFGVVTTALIVLPPLCRCLWWSLLMSVCRAAADLFDLKPIAEIASAAQSTIKCLIGILSASGSFLIVALTVVTTATGG